MRKLLTFFAVVVALSMATPSSAQKITATVRGTVTDATGAVVPGAKVTVVNDATGLTRSASTTSAGIYAFAELPVGIYTVRVENPGFKAEIRSNVVLNVAEARTVDVALQTGDISEVVTVEVPAVAVKLVGADVSGLVTGEEVRELPLNGRNFMQLTLLQPGVSGIDGFNTIDKGLAGGSDVSVSGGSTTSNLWTVDGANNNDVGSNRTILVYPSVDAIEEFKIQRNNYGAEFGQSGGAQVNLVTRGGTNEWKGSAYYFGRRDELTGTNFFLEQANQQKPELKWDDFGGTLGGPIIKDKLHFFVSLEWNKDKRSDVRTAFVPTQAERNGDFSQRLAGCSSPTPIDPLTGQPFPGNVIPANRINPAGQLMMQLMALPNTTPTGGSCNNWVEAVPTPVDWRQENIRVDWAISNSTRLMVRWTHDSWEADRNQWGDDPFPTVRSLWNQPGRSLVTQLNQNIGSTMVNSLTFSYSANKISVTRGGDEQLVEQLSAAIPTLFPADIKQQGGAGQPGAMWGSLGPYGGGILWNQAPWLNNQDLFVLKDDFSKVFGKHFLKVGALVSFNKKNEEPFNTTQESVQVTGATGFVRPDGTFVPGATTGNEIANWLLNGTAWTTNEVRTNKSVQQRWKDFEFYVDDTYKAGARVTANFGVRLTHFVQPYMADDAMGTFDPASINPALGNSPCNGMLYVPGKNPCPAAGLAGGADGPNRSLQPTKAVLVAPRVGVAWDVFGTGKTALRGGLGLFYARERLSSGLALGTNPPYSGTASVTRTLNSPTSLTGGGGSASFGAPSAGIVQEAGNSHNWQWNLSVQHELMRNTVLEVAYVGNKGLDLLGQTNLNEIAPANRVQYAQTGNVALRPLNGIAGIGDGNIALITRDRDSMYHGLQMSLVSRFGQGSMMSLAYTLSKSTANTGLGNADGPGMSQRNAYTDSRQPELDEGRSAIDRRHVFAGTLLYQLPYLEDKSAATRAILGGWQLGTIVQASTGYPYTIFLGQVPGLSGNGNLAGTGYAGTQRPNRVAGEPCTVNNSSTPTQWFNPNAWTINGAAIGSNTNSKRHDCDGPGFFRVDLKLAKNFKLGKRMNLQFTAEVFNVFDRVNFLSDDGNVQTTWTPQNVVFDTPSGSTATRVISATPGGGFGQLSRAADPRQAQLGLRFSF